MDKTTNEDKLKLDIVAMAAHELRTPLTAIIGYADSLTRELDNLGEEQKRELKQLSANSKLLENLIENLLDVSHLSSGSFRINPSPTDLVGLTREIVERFQDQAKAKGQNLSVTLPQKTPSLVIADRIRVGQVLSNLIINALNYTTEKGKISVTVFEEQDFVGVCVEDSGMGIAKEELPNLFTKYFRTQGVIKSGARGTGLGLYISKSIIDLHKGNISVESHLGKGTKFTFKLPKVKGQSV